jgi:hypothetical protein
MSRRLQVPSHHARGRADPTTDAATSPEAPAAEAQASRSGRRPRAATSSAEFRQPRMLRRMSAAAVTHRGHRNRVVTGRSPQPSALRTRRLRRRSTHR